MDVGNIYIYAFSLFEILISTNQIGKIYEYFNWFSNWIYISLFIILKWNQKFGFIKKYKNQNTKFWFCSKNQNWKRWIQKVLSTQNAKRTTLLLLLTRRLKTQLVVLNHLWKSKKNPLFVHCDFLLHALLLAHFSEHVGHQLHLPPLLG